MTVARLLASAGVVAAAPSAFAVAIATWDTSGLAGNEVSAPGAGSADVSAAAIVRGSGLGASSGSGSLNSNSWGSEPVDPPGDDLEFIQFGLEVGSGYCALLDTLFLTTRSSNTGPGTLGLYTSLDSFAAPIHTFVQDGDDELDSAVDLSSLGPVAGTLDFRLIEIGNTQADGDGTTSNGGTFRLLNYEGAADGVDVIEIHGRLEAKEAVPEGGYGAVLALVGFLSVGMAGRRWR